MTPDDAAPLFRYWRNHPPAHLILAAVHMKRGKGRASQLAMENDVSPQELIAAGIMKDNTKPTNGR